jgi:general secretion pathway protein G
MRAMTELSRPSRLIGRQRFPRAGLRAFSIVELMVAVLIISLLFAASVPAYQRIQRKARAATVANDFRVFGAAFQAYAHEKGSWPAEAAPGVVPAGVNQQELQAQVWSRATPMGGKFDWENNQIHPGGTSPGGRWRAALAITATGETPLVIDADLMEDIDAVLDDGNLETGNFRRGFGDCPLFILEP